MQPDTGSFNLPIGVNTTGIAIDVPLSFTPVLSGTTTAGVGTYTQQTGYYSQVGSVVSFRLSLKWAAHTGTGNMVISGLPANIYPAHESTCPTALNCNIINMTVTGPNVIARFNGTGANIWPEQVTLAGVATLIPIAASGEIEITGSYNLG